MKLFSKIKSEIGECSRWFRMLLAVSFAVYLFFWIFSIHLSFVQKAKGVEILLPSAPKDSIEYVQMSESLISGKGLAMNGRIETLRAPGYPGFVAIIKTVGGSYFAVTFVQILLVFASALVLRRIGMVVANKKVGEIAATMLFVNPVTLVLSLLILTDVLFMFLFLSAVYLAISMTEEKVWRHTALIALLLIFAVYVRGMGVFVLPIFATPFFLSKLPRKKQIISVAIVLVCIGLSTVPWTIRNYRETGIAGFSSFKSVQLAWVTPKFMAHLNGTTESAESKNLQMLTGVPEAEWYSRGLYDIRYSDQITNATEKIIFARPFTYAVWHITGSLPFLFPSTLLFARDAYDTATNYNRPFKYGAITSLMSGDYRQFIIDALADWWKVAERLWWLFVTIIALYTAWLERKRLFVWVFLFIFAYLQLLSGPTAGPRLSFQAWPFLFVLFASGATVLFEKYQHLKVR